MGVSSADCCEACLHSSPDPPAHFLHTLHAFCIYSILCLCLSLLSPLCPILFEPFACVVPTGCLGRVFSTLHCLKNYTGWQLLLWNEDVSSLSACCIVTGDSQVQKEGFGEWIENIVGEVCECTCEKKRVDSVRREEKAEEENVVLGIIQVLWVYIIVSDLCWSQVNLFWKGRGHFIKKKIH